MNWAVGVTTAPRPRCTLPQMLDSFQHTGFDRFQLFDDCKQHGAWWNWIRAVQYLLETNPRAEALLLCQDDVVFCRGLRDYLDRTLWPKGKEVALCSPYCPSISRKKRSGWHLENRGWYLVGALCWAIPRASAEALLNDLGPIEADRRIDARVGRWARQTGRDVWYHSPSLAQHIGNGNSALGDMRNTPLRRAADFIGEEAHA